jgi:hypothetical protein
MRGRGGTVDAAGLGPVGRKPVEVQVLPPALVSKPLPTRAGRVTPQGQTPRMIKSLAFLSSIVLLALLAAACGSAAKEAGPLPPANATSTATSTTTTPVPATTTKPAPTTTAKQASPPSPPKHCPAAVGGEEGVFTNLTSVRVGAHDGFDRIVFEFKAPSPDPGGKPGIPHYEVRSVKPPFGEDPSDRPLDVYGDAFARVVFQGATGYDIDNGRPTYTGPKVLTPGFGTLAQAVEGGDFETTLTWYLGLSRPTCWQVRELHNPDRVVIDFHHWH